jgi:hypothetical protein
VDEQVVEVGGGQPPQVFPAHVEATDARVGGMPERAVELEVDSAEALRDDGCGGRLATLDDPPSR